MNKIFCFDLDGTLCTLTDGNYLLAEPINDRIEKVNLLFEEGNKIIINTARGFVTGIDWEKTTKSQLEKWGVKYNELYIGKPAADYYIDDKSLEIKKWLKGDFD